jgi:hypothetical protein
LRERALATTGGTPTGQGPNSPERPILSPFSTLIMLDMISIVGSSGNAFTDYYCVNWSNILETYVMLEPNVASALAGSEEFRPLYMGKSSR